MLTSLLPGLRDLRAPLVVGYSWLLIGWLIFAGKLPKHRPPGNGAIANLFDLSHLVGPVTTVATISVVAYILGAILTIPTENRLISYSLSFLTTADGSTWKEFAADLDMKSRSRRYRTLAVKYAPNLRTRLLAANPVMYGEYDRLAAEAEFRVNLVLPLWGIAAVLVRDLNVNWQLYWRWVHQKGNTPISNQIILHNLLTSGLIWGAVLLTASVILLVQGANRLAMSRNVLMRAMMTGAIEIPDRLTAEIEREAKEIEDEEELKARLARSAEQLAQATRERAQAARQARKAKKARKAEEDRRAPSEQNGDDGENGSTRDDPELD